MSYPKSTGDHDHAYPEMNKSDVNFENYRQSVSSGGSSHSKEDDLQEDFHETGVLSLLEEEGLPRDN